MTSTNAVEAEEQQQQQQQRDELDRLVRSKKSRGVRVCLEFLLMDYTYIHCVWDTNYYVQDARRGAKAQEEDEDSKEDEDEATKP